MVEAISNILAYTSLIESPEAFNSDRKTVDACVRNFQILGDASKHIPASVKKKYPSVPWDSIKGMRNILVHEYFGTSSDIIWNTIQNDLPRLLTNLKNIVREFNKASHDWKICPVGEYFVHGSDVDAHLRAGHAVKEHPRRQHCREYSNELANVLTKGEASEIAAANFTQEFGKKALADFGFGAKGKKFDSYIQGWVKFWNDVLQPETPLDANMVKALIASESSFDPQTGADKKTGAKGLSQLMPLTIKALAGYRGELKDHLIILDSDDVFDPNLNIAAGVRWLFQKRETASRRLKRRATWFEAVEEYKDVLRRRLKNPKRPQAAIGPFQNYMDQLDNK